MKLTTSKQSVKLIRKLLLFLQISFKHSSLPFIFLSGKSKMLASQQCQKSASRCVLVSVDYFQTPSIIYMGFGEISISVFRFGQNGVSLFFLLPKAMNIIHE
jgi:hypothetical protein